MVNQPIPGSALPTRLPPAHRRLGMELRLEALREYARRLGELQGKANPGLATLLAATQDKFAQLAATAQLLREASGWGVVAHGDLSDALADLQLLERQAHGTALHAALDGLRQQFDSLLHSAQ